jgi:beta-N-acetylhexosaminidase
VAKHFPGLGGATGNTDVMPATTPPWADLQRNGLLPFVDAVASHVPAIMIANAVVPGLTTVPAGISPPAITGVLRERLGFNGLVMTDSLSAAALRDIGYSVPRAAVAALAAGADMILYDASDATVIAVRTVSAIENAVHDGRISRARLERAVSRVLAVKRYDLCSAG